MEEIADLGFCGGRDVRVSPKKTDPFFLFEGNLFILADVMQL